MRAISSMATRSVLAALAEAAAEAGLPALEIESVGGVDAAARVRSGEPWDLVFLAEGALVALADEGRVDRSTVTPVVVSSVAAAVASESAGRLSQTSAFADASAVREAIASAERVAYSTGPSGRALQHLIDRFGLTEQVDERLVQARPGVPVARLIADGEADLGFQQLSELAGQPGVRLLGTLPQDCAIETMFAGAVAEATSDPTRAARVLEFFAHSSADIKLRHHFVPPV